MTTTDHPTIPPDATLVATVDEGKVKPAVPVLDASLHTEANGYQCGRRDCPCWQESREKLPLNGNRPFRLLR
jgi:hypothetical protein